MGTDLWQCTLMAKLSCCPTGKETRPQAPWPDIQLSHIILTVSQQSFPYANNAERLASKQQVSHLKLLVWVDQGSNPRGLYSPISQNRRRILYSLSPPVLSTQPSTPWYKLSCLFVLLLPGKQYPTGTTILQAKSDVSEADPRHWALLRHTVAHY